ncbi:peptidoglycan DD-metalloendopeptidase family protein [Spirosoma sp. SC4-14]|uniref:peptidoglycan DD-metalloendopeptidase family protein n=1 Tax=Spirosoma sp. SC4-14 TaxID=3128900 RepID=UPI0030CE1787
MLLPFDFRKDPYVQLDFSATNPDLATLDLTNTTVFTDYVFSKLQAAGAQVGVGGYNEHRVIYRRSNHFNTTAEPREIHLGIDFWTAAETPVFTPMAGVVHSFRDNANFGDYGPTIILEHVVSGNPLYSLYGHLTRSSLDGLYVGKSFSAHDQIGAIGPYPENGDWPPHLHFQLMTDMLGYKGDFPGVCSLRDRSTYLALCPNPNDILSIQGL